MNSLFDTSSASGLIMLGVVLLIYFTPSLVGRRTKSAASIFILNLFLGWTLVGWVVALIWAFNLPEESKQKPIPKNIAAEVDSHLNKASTDRYEQLEKLKKLLDSGIVTETEYTKEKEKILNN